MADAVFAKKLRLGAKIVMGIYGAGNSEPAPIVWMKANKECDLIAECALDFLCFDVSEPRQTNYVIRQTGNSDYSLSNLAQFLNSSQLDWYSPTHEHDAPPSSPYTRGADYAGRPGFLFGFEDYEFRAMCDLEPGVKMRLPLLEEILGTETRFQVFNQKGYRAHPSQNLARSIGPMFGFSSTTVFLPFWTANTNIENNFVRIIQRDGLARNVHPNSRAGLRPVCRLNPETKLIQGGDGTYSIDPFSSENTSVFMTRDALMEFLGAR